MIDPHAEVTPKKDYLLSNELYNHLKFVAQIVLPALGALYFTLAEIWGLPAAEEVVGTIVVLDVFVGGILQISSHSYAKSEVKYDGTIDVIYLDDKKTFTLNIDKEPEAIEAADEIRFKVNPPII